MYACDCQGGSSLTCVPLLVGMLAHAAHAESCGQCKTVSIGLKVYHTTQHDNDCNDPGEKIPLYRHCNAQMYDKLYNTVQQQCA